MKDATCQTEKVEMTPYQKKMMIFFFKCIGSELSKTAIFFVIFSLMGLASEFWAALFFMMLYRTSSGGLHCKSYLSCLALSFLILFSGVM
ncbi:MAG: accessory gene regulator B family protein, partial [Lachnospiraceae bacterium]|nr:accessory gene regulator B family protein [Lachnospiraceae bacterium]